VDVNWWCDVKKKDLTFPLANLEFFDMDGHGDVGRLHVTYLITGFGSSNSTPRRYLTTTTLWLHSTRTIQVGITSACMLRF
jgi:hypothetical protein